ncbi:methyltransferase domain-containing protein [Iamia majanohamensis]|uniref:Methyltransferase domain-containing protein n=1 Tax=Iamia majanohamensis TaxID=467976 RepID=A0AAE9YB64_9ACTN|nr:methyltransferase domain-containing protein [Iamia majanohamensis]WCO69211.1 methyltransferase domain-containing protein [Iamia majanohamensis]
MPGVEPPPEARPAAEEPGAGGPDPGLTALEADDDGDPARFASDRVAVARWAEGGDVLGPVAARLAEVGARRVLDLGSGDGELGRALARADPAPWWCGLDRASALLAVGPRPAVRADLSSVPLADASVDAAVALWVLYHLDRPAGALREVRRVLRPGGWCATCTTARDDSPELLEWFAPPPPTPFDAEEAEAVVGAVLDVVDVVRWDGPLVVLPDADAVATYLRARGADPADARAVAATVEVPFAVTRRGVLVWARRPG